MPVYACYRGDCANLALEEPGCFVLKDAFGRDWFCVETTLPEIPPGLGIAEDMLRVQGLAHKHGLSVEGSTLQLFDVPDAETLARKLVLKSYPPEQESRERLYLAGWLQSREDFGTGRPFRVEVSNGQRTVEAEGANAAEAWYRVMQKTQVEKSVMTLPLQTDPVPLRDDGRGGFRVGDSRVPLDVVIHEFENGADPESIVNAYRTLLLADVYTVIAYYLRHRDEVNDHLRKRQGEAAELRREIESKQPDRAELRAKLLARRTQQEQGHASARG